MDNQSEINNLITSINTRLSIMGITNQNIEYNNSPTYYLLMIDSILSKLKLKFDCIVNIANFSDARITLNNQGQQELNSNRQNQSSNKILKSYNNYIIDKLINYDRFNNQWVFEGYLEPILSDFIEIDPKEYYQVEFEAKSIGSIESHGYFFIKCFESDKTCIDDARINIIDIDPVQIIGFSGCNGYIPNCVDCRNGTCRRIVNIIPNNRVRNWALSERFSKLAIYTNGLEELPHKSTNSNLIREVTNTQIKLRDNLSSEINIINGNELYARLHNNCGTYMYPAMANYILPKDSWTQFSDVIHGEVFEYSNTKFRKSTKYIKLGFLANYQQDERASMTVRKFAFTKMTNITHYHDY